MSYCRWSSMNWMCDVYCYESCDGGWDTHVAANRPVREPQPIGWTIGQEGWWDNYKANQDDLQTIERQDIGLPHDGKSFNDSTLEAFRDRLTMLKGIGYNIPEYVFDEIAEEIAIRDGEAT